MTAGTAFWTQAVRREEHAPRRVGVVLDFEIVQRDLKGANDSILPLDVLAFGKVVPVCLRVVQDKIKSKDVRLKAWISVL